MTNTLTMANTSCRWSVAWCVVLLGLASSSTVVLQDNGYEGVVVALEESLPASVCQEVVQGLEEVLAAASTVVFTATRGRANFRSVTVLVPPTWTTASCPLLETVHNATGETWDNADVRVTQERHPQHGPRPWTLHTRGCGQSGDYVSLGHELLLQNNTLANGRLVAHEWLQYRYGVFKERGEIGTPVHPPHYRAPDASWKPNTCANVPVVANPSCDPENLSCPIILTQEDNPDLTSSFMAFPEVSSVTHLCDEGTHDRDAPTRHNLLCSGKSAWEVMRASPDFQNNRNVEAGLRESDLKVKYVRARLPRIVLLVEDTNVMNVQKRWDFMRKAVRKMVTYDVPDGYSVGLVVFDSIAATKYPLTALTDGATREKVGSSLPRNPSQEGEHKRCIVCGLREALHLLRQDGPGGHVVMVTGGSGNLGEPEATEATHMLADAKVSLHAIIYPLTEKYPRPNAGLETLASRSGGHIFIVPDEGIGADSKLGMYYNLLDSLYHTLSALAGRSALPVKVHSAEHPGGRVPVSEGSFLVDPALGADTVFAIFYYDVTHVGNLIHLVNPQGQVIDTANMQKEDANINMITVRLVEAQVTPGLWRYKVANRADSHQALYVQVTSRPRPRPETPRVSVRGWTSHTMGLVNASDISQPLALYTEVVAGVAGVESAIVTATITKLGYASNGTQHQPQDVDLYDNGLTGPDMAQGDGVYSRYVPGLELGKYSIMVRVQGEVEGNEFARHVRLGMVDVVGTKPSPDALPPARVVDLRATLLPDTANQVSFTWTAPGGDLDYGTADRYVVMTSQNQRDLVEGGGTLLEGWPTPLASPAVQQHTITWQEYNTVNYLTLYAVDEEGNTAALSNIVTVFVPAPPTTTPSPPSLAPPVVPANTSTVREGTGAPVLAALDTRQLAVVFGCVGGFIVVVAIIVCYCTTAHRRHRKSAAAKKVHEVQDAYSVTVTVASKGTEFPDGKEALKDGIKKEYISPVESWSASQLLSSHQDSKRGSVSARSDNTSDHSASTKKSYGGSSGAMDYYGEASQYQYRHAGYPDHYPTPSDGYPTPTEGYPTPPEGYPNEGYPVPLEARSYISSQPSDSFLSVSCDLLPSSNGPPAYAAYPSYDSSLRSTKVPPPIPPKPKVLYTPEPYIYDTHSLDPHSSTPSVASEKRVRNVTMV
ncbi:calcium-activated chloride channel regulator 1-like [Homarus americanus]|uniref:calcium-activated chloride channel regulator 1-like n=1 Tax=Homarus americanus TaxID=6706 RepID=UPI001C473071|nr:calcium-activated chloride channel regulator 1-like [Homarus americanus]